MHSIDTYCPACGHEFDIETYTKNGFGIVIAVCPNCGKKHRFAISIKTEIIAKRDSDPELID